MWRKDVAEPSKLTEQNEPDWGRIVAEHGPAVWATVLRILQHHEDAQDCYQQVFLDALRSARRGTAQNWAGLLVSIATRRAIDRLRERIAARKRRVELPVSKALGSQAFSAQSFLADGPVREMELRDALRAGLAALPEKQAVAFWLRSVEELSYAEIAAQLEIDANQVGVLIHRARAALRCCFADDQPAPRETR
jgi:RNA polymerase sigma-70 factor (ECF subfamily)